ncbi:MAG: SAM-dependent chlorinase/fluorinase [Anaerolineales bacterium]|nr:SAM-dependent chlorinase/fluorinase [Chloroflexota bacterium]MBL6979899.1 SAM-dependent chlorinase/fluorinase [Anaerolineales bacterium]
MNSTIAILTDFGSQDPFVGIMKGVIAAINPPVQLIDLNNQIPPGDIQRAAFTLWQSRDYFSQGTIFLTVIDPGVGTHRRPVIVMADGYVFVGPDNGVFSFILGDDWQAWQLANADLMLSNPGNTFHGRDIFAPGAAHASRGIPGPEFGKAILDLVMLAAPKLESLSPGILRGEILHADHFGNLLTSLGKLVPAVNRKWKFTPWVGESQSQILNASNTSVKLPNGRELPWVNTFGEIPKNECAVLVGSSGLIEIVANRQNAAEMLELSGGECIVLESST